jgi:hypothetical protein
VYAHRMETNKLEELKWIYSTLANRAGVYLLENIVDRAKSYSVADVHKWGSEEDCSQMYEKIKDLVKVRIFEAVEAEDLDKLMAESILKTYYYKPFSDAKEKQGDVGLELDESLQKKLEEMILWCKGQERVGGSKLAGGKARKKSQSAAAS